MSTLSDLRGLQAAYDLKQALTQTDDRLFGSQKAEGGTGGGGGGGSLGDARMLPIVTPNGRSFMRDAAKGMRPLINQDQIKPGNILEYKSDTGEAYYAQVTSIGEVGIAEEGVVVKEVDAQYAANYLRDNPGSEQVKLTKENMRPELHYKRAPRGFWDTIFAPLDWLILKTHNSPLSRLFDRFSKGRNKEVVIVIGVVAVLGYLAFTFYLIIK